MNGDDEKEKPVFGTQERNVEIVSVGARIAETGILKTTRYDEVMAPDGVLEKIKRIEYGRPDCDHVGIDVGGECLCHLWWCRNCASQLGNCFVCGRLTCPTCGETTVLDKNKRYHRACWRESVKRRILG